MTMKSFHVTFGFAIITASQLALGLWVVALNGKGGKAKHLERKDGSRSRSKCSLAPLILPICSPVTPTDTHRCVPLMYSPSAQKAGNRIHKYIPRLRCVDIIFTPPDRTDPTDR